MPAPANPFPGMNPYLQADWSDVHTVLISDIRTALSDELPPDLMARAEEFVTVAGGPQEYRADVTVVEPWRQGFPPVWTPEGSPSAGLTVTEPIIVLAEGDTERWIEIRDARGTLITVIEVLSPANKRDTGWQAYRQKQADFLAAGVNLVEIDFIRGGQHVCAVGLESFTHPQGSFHLVCVSRRQPGLQRREVYPCAFRESLPTIRVPLRATDPDVPLALQPLVDQCYRSGRYWLADYRRPLDPPLPPDEAAWVEERVRAAGLV